MMSLSERIRPDIEAAPWVIEEVKKLEAELAILQKVKRLFSWVVVRRTDGTVSIGHPPRHIMDEISAVLREMIKEKE